MWINERENITDVCSKRLSDRDRYCVSVEAAPSLSFATPWTRSLCRCPNCPDHLLLSHFRQTEMKHGTQGEWKKKKMRKFCFCLTQNHSHYHSFSSCWYALVINHIIKCVDSEKGIPISLKSSHLGIWQLAHSSKIFGLNCCVGLHISVWGTLNSTLCILFICRQNMFLKNVKTGNSSHFKPN